MILKFQPTVAWAHCFGPMARKTVKVGAHDIMTEETTHLIVAGREKGSGFPLIPLTGPHFLEISASIGPAG